MGHVCVYRSSSCLVISSIGRLTLPELLPPPVRAWLPGSRQGSEQREIEGGHRALPPRTHVLPVQRTVNPYPAHVALGSSPIHSSSSLHHRPRKLQTHLHRHKAPLFPTTSSYNPHPARRIQHPAQWVVARFRSGIPRSMRISSLRYSSTSTSPRWIGPRSWATCAARATPLPRVPYGMPSAYFFAHVRRKFTVHWFASRQLVAEAASWRSRYMFPHQGNTSPALFSHSHTLTTHTSTSVSQLLPPSHLYQVLSKHVRSACPWLERRYP